jgi:hypothetical protein
MRIPTKGLVSLVFIGRQITHSKIKSHPLKMGGIPAGNGLPGHHYCHYCSSWERRRPAGGLQGDGLINQPARRRRSQGGAADPLSGCFPASHSYLLRLCIFAALR